MFGPSVTMSNTILADNMSSGSDFEDCPGTLNAPDYNLLEVVTGCTLTGNTVYNWIDLDPNLSPLSDNGGFTDTMALLAGSPPWKPGMMRIVPPQISAGYCVRGERIVIGELTRFNQMH